MKQDLPVSSGTEGTPTMPDDLFALRTENASLKAQYDTLRAQYDALQCAADDANQRFQRTIYAVSHELRTPMTSVKTGTQVVYRRISRLMDIEDAEVRRTIPAVVELLSIVLRQIDLLDRMLGDLLDVSRIETNRIDFNLQHQDLQTPIRVAIERVQALYPDRAISLKLPKEPIIADIDADRIRHVLTHLLLNALNYAPKEFPVLVIVKAGARQVRVEVRDHGPGLTAEEQTKIWNCFYRVPGMVMHTGSSAALGVGLYLSRYFIERQAGQIGVCSSPGHGTTFWFTLPRANTPQSQ